MPKGIYIRTPKHCAAISAAKLGHPVSDGTRKKIGDTRRGNKYYHPSCKNGCTCRRHLPKTFSQKVLAKMSKDRRGHSTRGTGWKHSLETRKKMSLNHRGGDPSQLGWKMIDFLINAGFEIIIPEANFSPYRIDALLAEEWIAFEADEKHHRSTNMLTHDKQRDAELWKKYQLPVVHLTEHDLK